MTHNPMSVYVYDIQLLNYGMYALRIQAEIRQQIIALVTVIDLRIPNNVYLYQ